MATLPVLRVDENGFVTETDFEEWILAVEEQASEWMGEAASAIAEKHLNMYVDTLVASGDPSVFDPMTAEWQVAVDEFLYLSVNPLYLRGSIGAQLGAPMMPLDLLAEWTEVVNVNASNYLATASNRIVGASQSIWSEVQFAAQQSISVGVEIPKLRAEVERITTHARGRAQAIARTETIGAYNGGDMEGARALGEYGPVEKSWLATFGPRTRASHAEANGQTVLMEDSFIVGGVAMDRPLDPSGPADEVVNCWTGDAVVVPVGGLLSVARSWWLGDLFKIETADGEALTVTPNHPVLTATGWKAAKLVEVGDEVLAVDRGLGDEDRPASIEELYRAASEVALPVVVVGSGVNFHGDRPDGDVEVVGANGELRDAADQGEHLVLGGLFDGERVGAADCRGDRLVHRLLGQMVTEVSMPDTVRADGGKLGVTAPPRFIRSSRPPLPFLWRRSGGGDEVGAGLIATLHPDFVEPEPDDVSVHAEGTGDGHKALARLVAVTKVVNVENNSGTHVYSLESGTGLVWTPAGLQSNCRCVMQMFFVGDTRPDGTVIEAVVEEPPPE